MTKTDAKIKTALDRYKTECEAANADIARHQAARTATKAEWIKFSERIRKAAERFLAEHYD